LHSGHRDPKVSNYERVIMKKAIFYHAGCPICKHAENELIDSINSDLFEVETVHLVENPKRIAEAERAGIKSVPAIVFGPGMPLHINFGASMDDVKTLAKV